MKTSTTGQSYNKKAGDCSPAVKTELRIYLGISNTISARRFL
jgi:hypothetical protein